MKKIATTWSKPPAHGQPPRPRCSHASCVIDHKLVVFGGWSSGNRFLDDVHIYSMETNTWSQPKLTGEARVRVGHSMTAGEVPHEVWVLGGTMGASSILDVQLLNLETMSWSTPNLGGSPPEARSRHSANRYGDSIYLFGGGDNKRLFNDVWRLDLKERAWSIVATQGTAPSGRWGHTATLVDTRLFVFGGHDGVHRLNDVHVLDMNTLTWFTPECKAKVPPSPRSSAALLSSSGASNPINDDAASSSGASGDESVLGDALESASVGSKSSTSSSPVAVRRRNIPSPAVAATEPTRALPASPSTTNAISNQTGTSTSNTSTRPTSVPSSISSLAASTSVSPTAPASDCIPPARAGHSANCLGRKLVIYGGGDGKLLGDMYYLQVDTYEWSVMESGNVPDRCAHTSDVVHMPGASRLLVFGGSNGIKTFNDLYLVTCSKNRVRAPSGKRKSNSILKSSIPTASGSTPHAISGTDFPALSLVSSVAEGSDSTSVLPPLTVNVRLAQSASSPRSPHSPKSPKSPKCQVPLISYKEALQRETLPPKTQLKNSGNSQTVSSASTAKSGTCASPRNLAVGASPQSPKDRLLSALKEVGLDKYFQKFVEQEISYSQLTSLSESHYHMLGITSIRDQALMSKLKENALVTSGKTASSTPSLSTTTHQAQTQQQQQQTPLASKSTTSTKYASTTDSNPTTSSPANSIQSTQPHGNASELVRKVQLSTDALASAAESLRAAANKAIRAEE